jgi:fatty-acid desaturase
MASIVSSHVKTPARTPEVTNVFERDRTFTQPINRITTVFMGAFHVGAIVALSFFTWKALLVAVVLWWVSGSLGIGMGYHRLLTHRGFKVPKWLEYFLAVCGTLALEGGPIAWVADPAVRTCSLC